MGPRQSFGQFSTQVKGDERNAVWIEPVCDDGFGEVIPTEVRHAESRDSYDLDITDIHRCRRMLPQVVIYPGQVHHLVIAAAQSRQMLRDNVQRIYITGLKEVYAYIPGHSQRSTQGAEREHPSEDPVRHQAL